MKSLYKYSPLAIGIVCILHAGFLQAANNNTQFDTSILKNRGLDTELSNYFSQSPRYLPGSRTVSVKINGQRVGRLDATFGDKGELCVTQTFLQRAGLVVPSAVAANEGAESHGKPNTKTCYDYHQDYPSTSVIAHPESESLDIVVPPEALNRETDGELTKNYQTGGNAGLLNYSVFTTKSTLSGDNSTYRQAMLEEGINMDDWLLRSRQSLTQSDEENHTDNLYTYVQHTIVPLRKQIQAGQITTTGSLLSGTSITGLQLIPEDDLQEKNGSGIQVTGIARNSQARVDIRQSGRLVYSTLVPAGAFTLTDVPVLSRNTDLTVSVTETNGSVNRYTIPAASLNGFSLSSPEGLAMALGRYRDTDNSDDAPWLATISDGWQVQPRLNLGVSAMTAQQYDAIAGSVDVLPLQKMTVSATVKASDDQHHDKQGLSDTLSMNYAVMSSLNFDASVTKYSSGYRELPDTLDDDFSQYTGQYSAGVHWSYPVLGTFSVSYTRSEGSGNSNDSRYINASWGRNFGRANINVSWQTQVNQSQSDDNNSFANNSNEDDLIYVTISLPLGNHTVSAYTRTQGNKTTSGLQTSGDATRNTIYTVSAERDYSSKENDFSGSLDSNLHYTRMGLSASTQGNDEQFYGVALSGGVVAHSHGVTFSPWAVKDTFAVIDAGSNAAGVEFSTPSGPVWSDHWGQAIVPSLTPYRNAKIVMNTASLPDDIDVDNGFSELAVGHGSVRHINFHMADVRRAMMTVTMADGSVFKKGSSIVDKNGNYIATAVDDGLAFIENISEQPDMYIKNDDGKYHCHIKYALPEKNGTEIGFEQVKGICQ